VWKLGNSAREADFRPLLEQFGVNRLECGQQQTTGRRSMHYVLLVIVVRVSIQTAGDLRGPAGACSLVRRARPSGLRSRDTAVLSTQLVDVATGGYKSPNLL
jgi:hypothetical protein